MTADVVTVVRTFGPRLTKRVHPGGLVEGYDQARHFDLFARRVDLAGLEELLRELELRPDCAVVRGAIADPARTRHVRRLLYPDAATGEAATLAEQPRHWVALDIDGMVAPQGLDPADLLACARVAAASLPAAFRDACVLVQATGSHALAPGLHLRLWYWLERPTTGPELKVWLKGRPVDAAIFGACQLIYTARPIFVGTADPLLERLAVRFGPVEQVPVPEPAALKPPVRPPPPAPGSIRGASYALATLTSLAVKVLTAPRGSRHDTLLLAAHRMAELESAGLVRPDETDRLLVRAAEGAGLGADGRDVEREVGGILAWARRSCIASPGKEA
jgi:hypothetical protein